jgi:tRNA(His) 5'-end guanylyltransferase
MKNDMLPDGVKFKQKEKDMFRYLPENTYVAIRFDGKNFSTFTKRFAKPYDEHFMSVMDDVTRKVAATIPGVIMGYTQSDEISIIFSDLASETSQMWFGGRVDKMLSIDDADEVEEYVRWRRFDAQKNSVTMAANVLHSHKFLKGIPSKGRLALLEGTEFEQLPDGFYSGRVSFRETFEQSVTQVMKPQSKKSLKIPTMPTSVLRSRWVTEPATRTFMEERFRSFL